ncbi:GlcG/HbpS family heme-binding protein [Deefgea rivuli]|uniref:GlcG/HbpS family heme-binding protein n=1 Tax=Deefgea rivuli TaxID=400948 RepID=UPI0004857B1E|nr:heme-binding protein [Deefgea rivuli]
MKIKRTFWPMVGLMVCAANGYTATNNPILQQPNMSLALANQLINATLNACHADNRSAVVAVVDRGGNLIAVQRDDQVGPHNTEAAQRKAFTALSTKTPTRLLAERARNTPDSNNLATLDSLLLIGGGVPIFSGKDIIGAIGVGGAGGAVQDESCALQAIQHVLPTTN